MNQVQPEFQKRFSNRVFVSVILLLIITPVVYFANWWIVTFIALGVIIATHEILSVRKINPYPLPIRIFIYTMMMSLIFYLFIRNNYLIYEFDISRWAFDTRMSNLELPTVIVTILTATLFFSSMTDVRFKVQDATYLITMTILISLSFQAFLFLRFFPSYRFQVLAQDRTAGSNALLLIYAGIGTFLTDIGAYLVGTFFGKHKMNVRISQNKTWEGFFGGVMVSFVTSFAFAMIAAYLGYPILDFLNVDHWYWLVLISLIMPLIATLGDFTFSIIKREYGIKNFSSLLGEHGGMLDRVDSFSMVCLVVALLLTILGDLFYPLF
jgi:phosphatidate cytidylyltransferase